MSATHIGIASADSMPDRRAMWSHFEAWVPRRSTTRSKSNMRRRLPVGNWRGRSLMVGAARPVKIPERRHGPWPHCPNIGSRPTDAIGPLTTSACGASVLAMPDPIRDTIFALSSGRPPAAIAVVRISGPRAGDALTVLAGRLPEPRKAALARVRDPATGEAIDEALALWFPGPDSETGEDIAEVQLHGGRAVIAAVL